jgi:hypothetical protein
VGNDVIDDGRCDHQTATLMLNTQGMTAQIGGPSLLPSGVVATFGAAATLLIVLLVDLASVL